MCELVCYFLLWLVTVPMQASKEWSTAVRSSKMSKNDLTLGDFRDVPIPAPQCCRGFKKDQGAQEKHAEANFGALVRVLLCPDSLLHGSLILDTSSWKGVDFTAKQLLVFIERNFGGRDVDRKRLLYHGKTPRWRAFNDQWRALLEDETLVHNAISMLLNPPILRRKRQAPAAAPARTPAAAQASLTIVAAAAARVSKDCELEKLRAIVASQRIELAAARVAETQHSAVAAELASAKKEIHSMQVAAQNTPSIPHTPYPIPHTSYCFLTPHTHTPYSFHHT